MPTELVLSAAGAQAHLMPSRGGLLSRLELLGQRGPVSLLWLPRDFDPAGSGWPGGGLPVLFPFAGRVFHEGRALSYTLDGAVWQMPIHGFAYASRWEICNTQKSEATLALKATAASREFYPFEFQLLARYELKPDRMQITLTVKNLGAEPLPFAAGLHPYFKAPLRSQTFGNPANGESGSESLQLKTSATTQIRVTPVGGAGKSAVFPEGERAPSHSDRTAHSLADPLLHNLILAGHTSQDASIVDSASDVELKISWTRPFNYLVLWSRPGAGFHCVEPWMGLPDAIHNNEGLLWLPAGESTSMSVALELMGRLGSHAAV